MKEKYVSQLSQDLQDKIRLAVTSALIAEGLEGEELELAISDAMDSRVSDLSDTIDLNAIKRSSI